MKEIRASEIGARHRGREGSAFIIALMVLVILTVIGLSLAMVTETEMLLGGNERVTNRTFYSAETGIGSMVSQLMVTNSFSHMDFSVLDAPERPSQPQFGYQVESTSFYPVLWQTAPFSKANEGSDTVYSGFFFGQVRARRSLAGTTQAEKWLSYGAYFEPMQDLDGAALWEGMRGDSGNVSSESY